MQRIAPSQRVGEELAGLLTGGVPEQLNSAELRGLLVRLGVQRVLQELLEAEQRDFLGADRYQRGCSARASVMATDRPISRRQKGALNCTPPGTGQRPALPVAAARVFAGADRDSGAAGQRDVCPRSVHPG